MPQKKGSDNYDALGSIFDFIFSEAEKKPDRRKPIKPTGISGNDQLTDAIAASLELPGAFVTNTLVDEFNGALEFEIATQNPYRGVGNVKVTSSNLVDLIKDPNKFVQDSVKKTQAIRKGMRAKFAGEYMNDLINNAWAHKYGDEEVKATAYGLSRAKKLESFKISKAIGEAKAEKFIETDRTFIANRSAELLGRRTFGDAWNTTMTSDEKLEFQSAVAGIHSTPSEMAGLEEKAALESTKRYLISKYGAAATNTTNGYITRLESAFGGKKTDIFNKDTYLHLESVEIDDKIANIMSAGPPTLEDEEKIRLYEKTKLLLKNDSDNIRKDISRIKGQLRSTTDPLYKKALQKQLKDTRTALRTTMGSTLFGKIGKWEGYIGSLQNIYGGLTAPNLVAAMLDGTFYDNKRNSLFLPNVESSIDLGGKHIVEFFTPSGTGNKLRRKYNQMATDIYYFTPRSIFRTLFYNGEGFAYLMDKEMRALGGRALGLPTSIDINTITNGLKGMNGAALETFIHSTLASARATGALSPRQLRIFEKKLKSIKSLKSLTGAFSFPLKIQTKISKFFAKYSLKTRAKIGKWLLSNPRMKSFILKNGAGKLLGRWIAKGGVDVLARTIVTAIAGALGMTVGPIGSFLVTALTWVATDLILKATGAFLNVLKYAVIGIVAILVLIVITTTGSISKFNKTTFSAKLTPPGDVKQCQLYELVPLDPNGPSPWGPAIISPPSGEECPLGTSSIRCNQGWVDNVSSHTNIRQLMPIDLGYVGELKAPQFCTDGDCKITSVWQIQCGGNNHAGGAVIFSASTGSVTYTFTTYHVKPVVSVGEKVNSGQTYAVVQMPPEVFVGPCWTGPHLHFEAKQDGVPVDPLELLQEFNCDVPDESGCM